jgi:hypothetical protein
MEGGFMTFVKMMMKKLAQEMLSAITILRIKNNSGKR